MTFYELTPAYGRDYKNKAEVTAAFNAGKDFEGDYQLGFSLVNKEQLPAGSTVMLRYKRNTMVTSIKINAGNTHAEHAAKQHLGTPCTAAHVNFGGGCLNCGWEGK